MSCFEVVVLLVLLRVGCAVGGSKGRAGSELPWFGWLYLESDASSGRLGVSSHQHVVRSVRGSAGAWEGSRLTVIGSSSPSLEPGSDSLKTTRGGEVRDRFWVSAHLSIRAGVLIKGTAGFKLRLHSWIQTQAP